MASVPNDTAVEEPEDAGTVIATVISVVLTAAVLWTAFSFRMYRKAKDAARAAKPDATGPTHKDIEYVRDLIAEQAATGKQVTKETLLRDIASAPAMVTLGNKAVYAVPRKLRKLHALLLKKGVIGADIAVPDGGEGAVRLLLAYQLHSSLEALLQKDARLDAVVAELQVAAADGALFILPSLYEASIKGKWLQPALATLALQVCLRSGLWSELDPKCVDIARAQLEGQGAPYPDVSLRLTAKSWMGQPNISPGTMIEVGVAVERAHAGASRAKYQKKVPTREGTLKPVMETYSCLVSRESDTEGGSKGSIVGTVDVDVFDVMQEEARSTLKMVAPKQPGKYELRVDLRSAIVLGVRAETTCAFEVVSTEALAAQHQDDDYD